MKNAFTRPLSTFLAGLLASLPLLLTLTLLGWMARLVQSYFGPDSRVGALLAGIGLQIVKDDDWRAYLIGILVFAGFIFLLGVLVQTRLKRYISTLLDSSIRRLPVIGALYDTADKLVALFNPKARNELSAMSPVWCFFGGEGGAAVLALMPDPKPIQLGGQDYLSVLVPTAPVPIGGGLLYVPATWVKPADIGVEQLSSVYLSMGLNSPLPPQPT